MQLDQLVYRQEVRPGLKVMVAPLGGSLANLSRRLNPSAGENISFVCVLLKPCMERIRVFVHCCNLESFAKS